MSSKAKGKRGRKGKDKEKKDKLRCSGGENASS